MARNFALIATVEKGSLAAKAGLTPGDKVVAINNQHLTDIIDYHILTAEPLIKLTVLRQGTIRKFLIRNRYLKPLGIKFTTSIFNKIKLCRNRCLFCFVDQMPPGLRPSLYVKDDDYRLSFFYGNFITLTNLTKAEINRIINLKLSPLYVSWQATSKQVRATLIRPAGDDKAASTLKTLDEAGIITHLQIVLCPGFNDAEELNKSLDFLATFKNIGSVGIVPVGLSKYRNQLAQLKPVTPKQAEKLILKIAKKQKFFQKLKGFNWVYLADEFYLLANINLPPFSAYDGFPQLENGIGITRKFLTEIKKGLKKIKDKKISWPEPITIITGQLSFKIVKSAFKEVAKATGTPFHVKPVTNWWLGDLITVTGLLSGADIMKAIKSIKTGTILIPDVCLNHDKLFLDSLALADLKKSTAANLVVAPADGAGLIKFLSRQTMQITKDREENA